MSFVRGIRIVRLGICVGERSGRRIRVVWGVAAIFVIRSGICLGVGRGVGWMEIFEWSVGVGRRVGWWEAFVV